MSTLDRFKEAQDARSSGFKTALGEIHSGEKTSHWIWYIFPQLSGLGYSSSAQFYALRDPGEAREYLHDSILCERLLTITEAVALRIKNGSSLRQLMGGQTDALKLVSSMTLFHFVSGNPDSSEDNPDFSRLHNLCEEVLKAAEVQGFTRCQHTLNVCTPPHGRD